MQSPTDRFSSILAISVRIYLLIIVIFVGVCLNIHPPAYCVLFLDIYPYLYTIICLDMILRFDCKEGHFLSYNIYLEIVNLEYINHINPTHRFPGLLADLCLDTSQGCKLRVFATIPTPPLELSKSFQEIL